MAVNETRPASGSAGDDGTMERLKNDMQNPIVSLGRVRLGKKCETGRLSAPKRALDAEGIVVADRCEDRDEFDAYYHAELGLLMYDIGKRAAIDAREE